MFIPKIAGLSGDSSWIDLGFVERERTPRELMALGIRLHLVELSLSNTVRELERLGVSRSRKAVDDWVHKADLYPGEGESPHMVALDEVVVWLDGKQHWLCAAVDPESNRVLHTRLFSGTTMGQTNLLLGELIQKHDVEEATFLVDSAPRLQAALDRRGLTLTSERYGDRNSVERLISEVIRRTSLLSNRSSHVKPATADRWLQAFARWHNETG